LLSGFGYLPNERFVMVARNNQRYSEEAFRLQVISTVVQVENLYWDLSASQQNVRVANSRWGARQLYDQNRKQEEVGTMAQSGRGFRRIEVAAGQRDLVIATTNVQMQETTLKKVVEQEKRP